MENTKERIDCFLAIFECNLYLIPQELRDVFDTTSPSDRDTVFSKYLLSDDVILESVLIEDLDMQSIIDGDFC
jgi:hypothetical protein